MLYVYIVVQWANFLILCLLIRTRVVTETLYSISILLSTGQVEVRFPNETPREEYVKTFKTN